MSCDSVFSATGRPSRAACARVCAFAHPADRQQQPVELLRRQLGERVGLVLGRARAVEMRAVVRVLEARVVAGRDPARAEPVGVRPQRAELDVVVARDARVGRAALRVVACEALDHAAAERLLEVEHVVRNAQHGRTAASVVEIVGAAARLRVRRFRRRVHLHRHADHVVARFLEQARCDRRIDSAAHRGDDACPFAHLPIV